MDEYYLANEKLINESYDLHFKELEKENRKNKKQLEFYFWGGGRFDSPPF
jgi:hypothetical protein